MFAWAYKVLKGIPPWWAQHYIELDTSIPPSHEAKYKMNPNYIVTIKHDIDSLLITRFTLPVKEAT